MEIADVIGWPLTNREAGLPLGTADLKRPYRVTIAGTRFLGEVFSDSEGRFDNGSSITTSTVVSETVAGDKLLVETQNTLYTVKKNALLLRQAALEISWSSGVAIGAHVHVTPTGDAYCINGALFAADNRVFGKNWIKDRLLGTGSEERFSFVPPEDENEECLPGYEDLWSGINFADPQIQEALELAIVRVDPRVGDFHHPISWGWNDGLHNDRVTNDPVVVGTVKKVLNTAADIIDGF